MRKPLAVPVARSPLVSMVSMVSMIGLSVIPPAHAGSRTGGDRGGGGGGGGRLGKVSGGIGAASSAAGRGGGAGPTRDARPHEGELYVREARAEETVVVAGDGTIVRRIPHRPEPDAGTARIGGFVGLHKVHESDGAVVASLAIEDSWFRLAGAVTRYHEDQMDGARLTVTVPTVLLGVRIDDRMGGRRGTRAYLEGGAAFAITRHDPMIDASLVGPIVGVHLEHRLGAPSLIGDAHVMLFEAGIRAYSARVGLRFGHLEAAMRVLDFNVGPALYGPEVGLRF